MILWAQSKELTMVKVSIIIPVYNAEKYLDECMQSVINQTMDDIEVICMDDGSKDSSLEILEEYEKRDKRIKVIHKDNSGYGDTVNKGIDYASGEYIGIVEPDDYIKPDMMEKLYDCAKRNDLDIVASNHLRFCDDNGIRLFESIKIFSDSTLYGKVINPHDNTKIIQGIYINAANLFKKKFLQSNNIRHNTSPGASYQDIGFTYQTLMFSEGIMLFDDAFYCYRQDNPLSSTTNTGNYSCVIKECDFLYNIIKNRTDEYKIFKPEICWVRINTYFYTLGRIAAKYKQDFLREISKELNSYNDMGELNFTALSPKYKKDVIEIMENPDKFYESYIENSRRFQELLKGYDSIIIYGAGKYGRKIYDALLDEDRAKVKSFVVSSTNESIRFYKGIIVREIEEFEEEKDNVAVIVGVSQKYRDEIISLLKAKEFKNIVIIDTIAM